MAIQYPIRTVAKLTGIKVDTLRAWERRYKAITPARTSRGRAYQETDIKRLLLLRSAVNSGRAIGQVASLSDAELEELDRKSLLLSRKDAMPAFGEANQLELHRLLDSVRIFDYATANEELGRLALLLRPPELVHRIVLPLMRMAGENWESGLFSITQEHMISACVRNLLGGLVRLQKNGHETRTLLFTTLTGELHEFGILAAAMLAAAEEFRVVYLGPNLPANEVLLAAEKSMSEAVVLGIMRTNATPRVRKDIQWLAAALPANTELWVGGSGATAVTNKKVREGLYVLRDLVHFEQQLARWKATFPRGLGI